MNAAVGSPPFHNSVAAALSFTLRVRFENPLVKVAVLY